MRPASEEDLEAFDSLRAKRCPEGHFIGDGSRVVRRMLREKCVVRVVCTEDWTRTLEFPPGVEVLTAPRERLDQLVGFRLHQGLMALGKIPAPQPLRGSLLVALDGLSNAENVGAIMRTCAAFGVEGVIVGPGTASPWLRRAVRVSLGAPLRVPVHFAADLAAALRPLNAYAAHIHGERRDYRDVDYAKDCCLVLGGEAHGVSPEAVGACRNSIYIPMEGGWDCLNVASSAAVLLSEVRRQRRKASTSPP
jgi:tRNA G18 (ribose-2'-O)-methylase SpoU